MKNRRALFSAITSLTMLTLAVIACEDDTNSVFPGADKPDTSVDDTGPGFNTDSKATDKDANVNCPPILPTTFAPTFKAVEHQDACAFEQLTDYYAHCLATDTTGNALLKSAECTTWREAAENTVCAHCIETDDNAGPVQIYNDRLYFTLNNAGCVAIKQKAGGTDTCAEKYDTSASCRREACKTCLDQQGADFDDFIDCEKATLMAKGDCVTYQNAAEQTCGASGYKDAGSSNSALDCFGKDQNESQGDVFVRVEGVFCKKP